MEGLREDNSLRIFDLVGDEISVDNRVIAPANRIIIQLPATVHRLRSWAFFLSSHEQSQLSTFFYKKQFGIVEVIMID